MHLRRSLQIQLAQLLAIALLFSQLALSSYACPMLAERLNAQHEVSASDVLGEREPCNMSSGAMDTDLPLLCAEYARPLQQSDQSYTVFVPDPVFVGLYPAPEPQSMIAMSRGPAPRDSNSEKPPPAHTILHCCLRI